MVLLTMWFMYYFTSGSVLLLSVSCEISMFEIVVDRMSVTFLGFGTETLHDSIPSRLKITPDYLLAQHCSDT